MHIDRQILKIIFQVDTEERLDKVVADYTTKTEDLALSVINEILTNPEIPKPKVRGIQALLDLPQDEKELEKYSEEELGKINLNAMQVAMSLPIYSSMLERYTNRFNQTLFDTQLPKLKQEEVEELQNYLKQLNKNIITNAEKFDEAGKELAEVAGLEEVEVEKVDFAEITDSTSSVTPVQETQVETAPVEPTTPEPVAEEVTPVAPAETPVTQDDILTPVEEPKPTLPPTSDLPERKISVGTEPEASKPVSFSR